MFAGTDTFVWAEAALLKKPVRSMTMLLVKALIIVSLSGPLSVWISVIASALLAQNLSFSLDAHRPVLWGHEFILVWGPYNYCNAE